MPLQVVSPLKPPFAFVTNMLSRVTMRFAMTGKVLGIIKRLVTARFGAPILRTLSVVMLLRVMFPSLVLPV
jgi:hypothetical protein